MLKQNVTYKPFFSEEEVTKTLYFNFTKTELVEIFMTEPEFLENLQDVYKRAEAGDVDGKALIASIKDVIRRSYGVRINDEFVKTPELVSEFMASATFDAFFFDLMTKPEDTAAFIENVMPADLIAEAKKEGTFPNLQDHLPKQTKNVFDQADLGEYSEPEVETMDVVSAYPDSPEGETMDVVSAYPDSPEEDTKLAEVRRRQEMERNALSKYDEYVGDTRGRSMTEYGFSYEEINFLRRNGLV